MSLQEISKKLLKPVPLIILSVVFISLAVYLKRDAISTSLTYNPSTNYTKILQNAPSYDIKEKKTVTFTYQETTNTDLVKFKETYKLDQVAGSETNFAKAKNLMTWIHKLIAQDGSSPMPQQHDSMSLITYAQEHKQGLKCRGLAIILNEALLSVGIKSRMVELIPKNFSTDSHVITAAYIPEYEKWVFLDPSLNAYFVNEQGTPLSPLEVRQSLIEGKQLKANDDILHGEVDYINYLAKNIYEFASPVSSSYGYDSRKNKKFVVLAPKGMNFDYYHKPFSYTIIHNEEEFWKKP